VRKCKNLFIFSDTYGLMMAAYAAETRSCYWICYSKSCVL